MRGMRVELASHVVVAAIVVTCLSVSGDAYVLPDDVIPPTLTHRHRHEQQQQQHEMVTDDVELAVTVTVKPQYTVMHRHKTVHISCTATATNERPYLSFFVSLRARLSHGHAV